VAIAVLAAFVPLVLATIVLARPIIALLYGPAFLPAVPSARILCVAMLFYGLNTIVTTFTMAIGLPWFAVHVWWIGFALNVAANLWLIPARGIEGAALASLGAYFAIFVMNLAYALWRSGGVQVERDFDALYKDEDDPWSIGEATHDRYDLYLELVNRWKRGSGSMLDIGCGQGAVLNRFEGSFERLVGIELSEVAIAKGRERFPRIEFRQGSADKLEAPFEAGARFDAILYSDVICYLDEGGKNRSLAWIHDHLTPAGIALVAAWCPRRTVPRARGAAPAAAPTLPHPAGADPAEPARDLRGRAAPMLRRGHRRLRDVASRPARQADRLGAGRLRAVPAAARRRERCGRQADGDGRDGRVPLAV
jgi:SAM-dependent methyltransferase